jgi:hypothetical protein
MLERPGELFGVAREVGLLTRKAVLRCLQLGCQGMEKMLKALEQAVPYADTWSRSIVRTVAYSSASLRSGHRRPRRTVPMPAGRTVTSKPR